MTTPIAIKFIVTAPEGSVVPTEVVQYLLTLDSEMATSEGGGRLTASYVPAGEIDSETLAAQVEQIATAIMSRTQMKLTVTPLIQPDQGP